MPSARESRSRERATRAASQARARETQKRAELRTKIRERLLLVPPSWRTRYRQLLQANRLAPETNLGLVHNTDALSRRAALLPPEPVYVHMRNARHSSQAEPRVLRVTHRRRHTRSANKSDCNNARTVSPTLFLFPERPNVARVKPDNLLMLTLPSGHQECVNLNYILKAHRRGQTISRAYQRDAQGDEWAEMRLDTEVHGQVRLPLWLLNAATGLTLKPTAQRVQPPHATTYA